LLDYSRVILDGLRAHQVRAKIDDWTDKINGKIQRAEQMKVHTLFVIGSSTWKRTPSASASTAKAISAPNGVPKPSQKS